MSQTITMPKLGFDMAEGTLVRWVKDVGETIQKGDIVAEIETDKATLEIDSAYAGVIARRLVEEGSVVPVGTPIAIVTEPGEKLEEVPAAAPSAEVKPPSGAEPTHDAAAAAPATTKAAPVSPENGRVTASPLARRIAREKGVELGALHGSGPGGRIVKRDLEGVPSAAAPQAKTQPSAAPIPAVTSTPAYQAQVPSVAGEDVSVPLSRLRSAIGRRMQESKQNVPHFYVTRLLEVDKMLDLRKQINDELPEGEKISVNDFIVKAVALTLRQFPNINASLGENAIIQHAHVNVGVAVAVEGGLLTVVVRDADVKPLRQIAHESVEMVSRARQGKVKPEDIEGSTFSVSNMGMYEVDEFSAIINPPEVAILAVSAAKPQPVARDGKVEVAVIMPLTLSADHRVTDGVEAARFMQALAHLIENPWLIII